MTDRMKKGLVFSLLVHIVIFALLGTATMNARFLEPQDVIYDVALMGAGGDGGPAAAANPAPKQETAPPQEETPKTAVPKEELPPPRPDDITEETAEERPEQPPETPSPATESAPPAAERTAPGGTGQGGIGDGPGAGSGGQGDGPGGGTAGDAPGAGIPPASDAIEAPTVPPRVTASQPPSYPSSARSRGIEGRVVVRFTLDKEGGIEDLEIVESSGNDALDQAALQAAEEFRFSPGLDGYGRPVRCYAYQPFTFRLR